MASAEFKDVACSTSKSNLRCNALHQVQQKTCLATFRTGDCITVHKTLWAPYTFNPIVKRLLQVACNVVYEIPKDRED